MKKILNYLSIIILLLVVLPVTGQNIKEKTTLKLKSYIASRPQEKLFIHLDKPFYTVADDIWFKTYLVDAINHVPRKESLVYVELIDESKEIITSRNIQIVNGGGFGVINLSSLELKPGSYFLRGYTSYMRNFDEEFFFNQKIQIINPDAGKKIAAAKEQSEAD